MSNGDDGCTKQVDQGKRTVCRRSDRGFHPRSANCKRCSLFSDCPKKRTVSINGVSLSDKQLENMCSG